MMLETVRKGMWEASAEQVEELASLHAEVLEESEPRARVLCAIMPNYASSSLQNCRPKRHGVTTGPWRPYGLRIFRVITKAW